MNHIPHLDLLPDEAGAWSWGKPPLPSPSQVTALQGVQGYPCVSVLLSTSPAPRMIPADITRLKQWLGQASDRLHAEPSSTLNEDVLSELERIAAHVTAQPTAAAVALYASAGLCEIVYLPVPVRDRVVVDPTFATRDLVRSLHQTPRHVVLVLTATEARLFHGVADTLRAALRSRFPLHNESAATGGPRRNGSRTGKDDASTLAFLRAVDRALGAALRLNPPLILVGPERVLATFRAGSRNLDRLAGTVTAATRRHRCTSSSGGCVPCSTATCTRVRRRRSTSWTVAPAPAAP